MLSGAGKGFTAGIDLKELSQIVTGGEQEDPGRKAFNIRKVVQDYQNSISSVEVVSLFFENPHYKISLTNSFKSAINQ